MFFDINQNQYTGYWFLHIIWLHKTPRCVSTAMPQHTCGQERQGTAGHCNT